MQIDLNPVPKIRREPYLDYEFQANLDSGSKVLFNDPTLSYNHLVALKINNKLLRFQLVGAQPTMTIPGDDFLVYPSVLPDVDLAYELYAGRLKEILIINSNQAQHEFNFLLETNEVTAYLQEDNSIIYKDANDNIVWTIEAPYATDANGSDVPVTMQFDGDQYTVIALPTENTTYPIKLDPTVTLPSAYIWNEQGVINAATMPAFRFVTGRADGSQLISSLIVYNKRASGSTNYEYNYFVKTYYQFFDKNYVAVSGLIDLVTVNFLSTIAIPSDAYLIEFTGSVPSATSGSTNILQLKTAECIDTSSHWDFTQKPLPYYTNAYVKFSIPKEKFNSTTSGTNVSETYDAPFGTTFTPGTCSVFHQRSSVAYLNNCYVDLYNDSGTLISSTQCLRPSTAGSTANNYTTRITSVTVPAGITRITLRGVLYSGSTTFSWPTAYFETGTSAPEYGTAKYSLTLTEDVQNAKISPGFSKAHPVAPYKTYVSYNGDITGNYVESSTVTVTAGSTVYIKISLTANESTTVMHCNNICLIAGSTVIPVELLLDSSRQITKSANAVSDSFRKILSSQNCITDTNRTISTSISTLIDTRRQITAIVVTNLFIDSIRKVINSSELIADTKRNTLATITATPNTLRKLLTNTIFNSDTVRKTIKAITSAADSKRRLNKNDSVVNDTIRKITITASTATDAKRSILKSILALVDTKRNISQNMSALVLMDTVRKVIKSIMTNHDSTRSTQANATPVYDTLRRSTLNNSLSADTKRSTTKTTNTGADTKRSVNKSIQAALDTTRRVMKTILIESDTKRSITEALYALVNLDTKRQILNSVSVKSDLTRCILSASLAAINTKRRLTVQQALRSDSKRKVTESVQIKADTGRKITIRTLKKMDTNRKIAGYIHISYDMKRTITKSILIQFDTKRIVADRIWPHAKRCELNIQIQGKNITILSYRD